MSASPCIRLNLERTRISMRALARLSFLRLPRATTARRYISYRRVQSRIICGCARLMLRGTCRHGQRRACQFLSIHRMSLALSLPSFPSQMWQVGLRQSGTVRTIFPAFGRTGRRFSAERAEWISLTTVIKRLSTYWFAPIRTPFRRFASARRIERVIGENGTKSHVQTDLARRPPSTRSK